MLKKIGRKAFGLFTVLSACMAVILAFKITQSVHAVCVYDEVNEQVIHDFLRDELGFNEAAICGIMGNIYTESKFDANALNPNDTGGSFSYGICQWNSGGRYYNLINWSVGNGAETGIMEVNGVEYQTVALYYQLCYMAWELRQAPYYRYAELLQTENTVEGAAEAAYCWARYYEGCSIASHEYRKNKAVEIFWPKYGADVLFGSAEEEPEFVLNYEDVSSEAWYYDYVKYVAKHGVMTGYSDTVFAPNDKLTRAMTVMMLYKMEGYPQVEEGLSIEFDDVKAGKWYADAIHWAAQNGIIEGSVDDEGRRVFYPDQEIKRQDFIKLLYAYSSYKGIDVSVENDEAYLEVADAKKVSKYARSAVNWGYSVGLIGVGSNLKPKSSITRAETATIVTRFMEKFGES